MEAENNGGASSAPAAVETVADNDVKEMTQAQYAEFLTQKAIKPEPKNEDEKPAGEVEAEAQAEPEAEPQAAESSTDEQSEQSESTDEAPETEEVLSKSEPIPPEKFARWQANVQKRIDELTAAKKASDAMVEQLKAAKPEATEPPAPVVVPLDNPDDKTATVRSESDLDRVENEARNALDFIEEHRIQIQKALLRDEDTVTIDGQTVPVERLVKAEREAKRHLDRYIPARRQFLKAHVEAVSKAQSVLPALFDKATPEYQEYQAFKRANPAFNALPNADHVYALFLKGQAAIKSEQEAAAKKPVTPAAAKAPKTAGDTGAASPAKPAASRTQSSEKTRIKAELEKAEKKFRQSGSQSDYSQVLVLQSRLKKL
jgi:hypothetical protein